MSEFASDLPRDLASDLASDAGGSLIAVALDPARSVVVEACAGSGKTWLLASRIVRLLLAGIAPGEILAITFTRKAAREIEERVVDWLRLLATGNDGQVAKFLAERGVPADARELRCARGLYERVVGAQPRLAVNTFHGWFLQLVAAAPLSAKLVGATLVDSDSRLFDECWQAFASDLQKDAQSELTRSFVSLLQGAGLDATRHLVRRGMDRRAEWLAFTDGQGDPLGYALDELRARLGVGELASALVDFFAASWSLEFHAYLGLLELSELETDRKLALRLRPALPDGLAGEMDAFEPCFAALRDVLLTRSNTLRIRKPSAALNKRFGAERALRFLGLHARLGERILYCLERQIEEHAYAFNRDAYRVLQAFLEHVEKFKAARRQFDFVDAEWRVLQLLRDEAAAAFLQVRLDARYSHVLLDEFQDTNPLQWQILLAWLGAYSDAARPGVFMVGDPKQSIYRFRRAEPRLFAAAASFLESHFAAARCSLDITRRNAQPIIDVVNALFLGVPEFEPFREQQSLVGSVPGRVELIPLCEDQETGERSGQSCDGLRDPLTEAASEVVDLRRFKEAAGVAERIQQMVGSWEIEDIDASGTAKSRPMRYGDIMLLTRSRTKLAEYEKALVAADIPFDAASRGGLLATLEARDMAALLEFLVSPVADLQLAQALRSPIFACTDEDLLCLAARKEATWWLRLQALVESNAGDGRDAAEVATPRLRRAASLLGDWLKAADRLPAHDLVDRIFHQGEVLARYRLAVPPAVRAGVEASLQALLLLSLDLDGGRYPSLPRFIDELRELQAADAGDAPDEGAIESAVAVSASESGRVRILTIHGAKGLESPLVWLLDANAAPRAAETWDVLVDWPPQSVSPQHFSFYGRADGRGKARQPLFENQSAAAAREELNLLYVAITRARQVFIASGIAGTPGGAETPYRRLQSALEKLGGSGCRLHGVGLPQANGDGVVAAVAAKLNEPVVEVLPLPRLGERRRVPDAGERFGILLHASLERRTGKSARDGWWRDSGFDDAEYKQVMPVAERLLATPALQRFFDSACYRRAWNELDVSGSDGALRRIDRLVEFDDALWVLDYKSSGMATPRIDAYKAQVADYCAAVAAVFSERPVRGALVFSDASLIEVH